MQDKPIVSIVIPTYNRYKYLKGCIEATLSISSHEMEIIVHDNTEDNSEIVEFINTISDDRVKYFHLKEHVTVSENCDLAVSKSQGQYVCLIGDDDTVCSNIIDLAKCMAENNIDTCVFGICKYHWPDLIQLVPTLNSYEAPKSDGSITYIEPAGLLHSALKKGVQSISALPRVYHAMASRSVLDEIKKKTGSFFPGPSPDMANAMGCLLYSKKHIKTDIPVMISGYGENSAGGLGRRKMHKGSLKDKPWLPSNIEEIWDPKIPKLWMGNTIWPESAVIALNALDRSELLAELNYSIISAETLLHDSSAIKEVLSCHLSIAEYCKVFAHCLKRVTDKIFKKNVERKEFSYTSKTPISIIEAKKIQEEINERLNVRIAFNKR